MPIFCRLCCLWYNNGTAVLGGKTLILPLYVAGKDGRANAGFPLLNRDYRNLRLRLLLISLQNHRINVSLKFTEKSFVRFRGRRLMHLYDQLPLISSQVHQKQLWPPAAALKLHFALNISYRKSELLLPSPLARGLLLFAPASEA